MKLLAIETSTRDLGVAIADERSILAWRKGSSELRHSQDLLPNIDHLLRETGLRLVDMDCFAISIGPGSFTGLRVGVSAAKGLNLVTGIPVVAVPTLDAIAYNATDPDIPVCIIVDARKGNLYAALYKHGNGGMIRVWGHALMPADEVIAKIDGETLFAGDGLAVYGKRMEESVKGARLAPREQWFPDVRTVARLGIERSKKGLTEDPDTLTPLYLYSKECNVKGICR
jgi:tRNA threonylcarbamoyladenosine biosynthesis protein TsaB